MRWVPFRTALLLSFAMTTHLMGQTAFRIIDTVGDPQSITAAAGDTFAVKVNIDTDDNFTGYSLFIQDNNYTGTPHFTITGRTRLASNPFTTPNTPDASFAADPITSTTLDLGYSGSAHGFVVNDDLMTLNVLINPSTPNGTYVLQGTTSSFIDVAAGHQGFDIHPSYTVTVVPEPASVAMGLAAFVVFGLNRSRRRAAQ